MKLRPVPKEIIWGGDKLKKLYGKTAPFRKIAESWELTVRDSEMSVIENGPYSGMTLDLLLSQFPEAVGDSYTGEKFPLLVKFIDAEDDLSIQVHPNEACAERNGGEGKTEMWYIAEADEGASIIYGMKDGVSRDGFAESIRSGDPTDALKKLPVKKGDVYFIPAGQIHAICKGVLIAEIQQNSDTTYRVYDYERTGADGKKRELHVSKALDSVRCFTDAEIKSLQFERNSGNISGVPGLMVLCSCRYFKTSLLHTSHEASASFCVSKSSFVSLLFTDAYNVSVTCGGASVRVCSGDSVFIPAGAGEVTLDGCATVLISEC